MGVQLCIGILLVYLFKKKWYITDCQLNDVCCFQGEQTPGRFNHRLQHHVLPTQLAAVRDRAAGTVRAVSRRWGAAETVAWGLEENEGAGRGKKGWYGTCHAGWGGKVSTVQHFLSDLTLLTHACGAITWKTTTKCAKFEIIKAFFSLCMSRWNDFY